MYRMRNYVVICLFGGGMVYAKLDGVSKYWRYFLRLIFSRSFTWRHIFILYKISGANKKLTIWTGFTLMLSVSTCGRYTKHLLFVGLCWRIITNREYIRFRVVISFFMEYLPGFGHDELILLKKSFDKLFWQMISHGVDSLCLCLISHVLS